MLADRIEAKWIEAFVGIFQKCNIQPGDEVAILSETQSRQLNVHLAELALDQLRANYYHIVVPSPRQEAGQPSLRSTGASLALDNHKAALASLKAASVVVDLTVEGPLHSKKLPQIIADGARILMISNEHPDALERMAPDPALEDVVKKAVKQARATKEMRVTSKAGTDLIVNMEGASTAGVWGWSDRPKTVAHWPGGIVVSFPKAGSVNGRLVLDAGDINLTFKRYIESQVIFTLENDYVTEIEGNGVDAALMREYFAAWGDKEAYATSHVGWGLNPGARYEALTMYDQRETNCTELRAVAGNFLYSTGANEFAGRFTKGHFDLPMMNCTIELDGVAVVRDGKLVEA